MKTQSRETLEHSKNPKSSLTPSDEISRSADRAIPELNDTSTWEIASLSYEEMLEAESEDELAELAETVGAYNLEISRTEAPESSELSIGEAPLAGATTPQEVSPKEWSAPETQASDTGLDAKQSIAPELQPDLESSDQPGKQLDMEKFLSANVVGDRREEKFSPIGVEQNLTSLAELLANVTESFSSSIFLLDSEKEELVLAGAHTLSRDFIEEARIPFGSGLIAWVAENKVRVSVCPFEHDARTLQVYKEDQGLKSFLAVPIKDHAERVLGVVACDSKKTYAFSKTTEKLVEECAKQAASIIELHKQIDSLPATLRVDHSKLDEAVENFRNRETEQELLESAANLSRDIIDYESIVVVTSAVNGIGDGRYFSSSNSQTEHRLLELVCKQKKIICSDRSVHALPTDDLKQRSFLSIPFKSIDREAGSINLLSQPQQGFDASEIAAAEKLASVLGSELERIRLKEFAKWKIEPSGFYPWDDFRLISNSLIRKGIEENQALSLLRLSFSSLNTLELKSGAAGAMEALKKVERLIEQVKKDHNPATKIHSSGFLVLLESSEVDNFIHRLCNQIERLSFSDLDKSIVCEARSLLDETRESEGGGNQIESAPSSLGDMILREMSFTITKAPRDGETLVELNRKALRLYEENKKKA